MFLSSEEKLIALTESNCLKVWKLKASYERRVGTLFSIATGQRWENLTGTTLNTFYNIVYKHFIFRLFQTFRWWKLLSQGRVLWDQRWFFRFEKARKNKHVRCRFFNTKRRQLTTLKLKILMKDETFVKQLTNQTFFKQLF